MVEDEMKKYYVAIIGIVVIVAIVGIVNGSVGTKKGNSDLLVGQATGSKLKCKTHKISIEEILNKDDKISVSYKSKGVADQVRTDLSTISNKGKNTVSCPLISGACGGAPGSKFLSCTIYTQCDYPISKPNTRYFIRLTDLNCPRVYDTEEIKPK